MESMTLDQLYSEEGAPPEGEMLWGYVGHTAYQDQKFQIVEVDPVELMKNKENRDRMQWRNLDADGKRYITAMRKAAKRIAARTIIVVSGDELVDGHHRVYALAKERVRKVQALDLDRPVKE